jgi:tellurite methyltransferase
VRQKRDERGDDAEGDVAGDVVAAKPEYDRCRKAAKAEKHGREERLSHRPPIMSPSPFVVEWLRRLPAPERGISRALDVAAGRGRHSSALLQAGYRTFGVDIRFDAVRDALDAVQPDRFCAWCADLTQHPLPRAWFDMVLVTRYLQRDLFPALCATLRLKGIVIYETFTTAQPLHGTGPTSSDHLLEPGELLRRFDQLEVVFSEEVFEPEAVARIVARRISST